MINNGLNRIPIRTSWSASHYCFALLSLLVTLLIIYWPGFTGDWYLDDFGNIHENPNVHLTTLSADKITKSFYGMNQAYSRFSRPLSYFSLALNYYFGGTNPLGYHIVNFSIHYGTSVFLFLLTLNLLKLPGLKGNYEKAAYPIALLSTLLWATHPIQVNAVTYIVQRMASLAGMFTVLSLYCYLKARTFHWVQSAQGRWRYGWYAACVIAGGCALASKQNAAMLPFSLLLFEILLIRETPIFRKPRQLLKVLVPAVVFFLLLVVLFGGLSVFQSDYSMRPFSMVERVMTQPRVIWFYTGQLLYPFGAPFTLLHDFNVSTSLFSPWTTLPAILLGALAIGLCLLFSRRWPLFAFSTLFFFLNHTIESSIIPLELIFEHRNYLPSLFFFILPALGIIKGFEYFSYSPLLRNAAGFGAIVWIMGQAHTTYMQNSLYQNKIEFWRTNVSLYPDLHRPRHNLAKTLLIFGFEDQAEKQMYQSLNGKSSAQIHQKYITSYNLGVYYLYREKYQQALEQFAIILKSSPQHVKTLQKTAELYLETGNKEKARHLIDEALTHKPESSSLHVIKGFVLLSLGKIEAAFEEASRAEELKHNQLAVTYIRGEGSRLRGNLDNALKYFEQINALGSDHYAVLIALVELCYLNKNFSRMEQTMATLEKVVAERNFNDMLAAYDRRWNFVGNSRMSNLAAAFQN